MCNREHVYSIMIFIPIKTFTFWLFMFVSREYKSRCLLLQIPREKTTFVLCTAVSLGCISYEWIINWIIN